MEGVAIDCGLAQTNLDYIDGDQHARVVYNNLCGYYTVQRTVPDSLSLPSNTLAGLRISLLKDGQSVTELPSGASIALYFDIPTNLVDHQFAVMFWDAQQGKWIELTATVEDGKVVVVVDSSGSVSFPASFVLVDQSAAQTPYQSLVSFFADLLEKLAVLFRS